MATKTYDPGKYSVSFAGNIIGGFADGSFVKGERNEQAFTTVVGATGEVCRVRNRNKSGKVTLTLMQSSFSNDVLSTIAALDESFGTGQGPLFIKDQNGTTVMEAQNAWIEKVPDVEAAKELSNREWVIACAEIVIFAGGNL